MKFISSTNDHMDMNHLHILHLNKKNCPTGDNRKSSNNRVTSLTKGDIITLQYLSFKYHTRSEVNCGLNLISE